MNKDFFIDSFLWGFVLWLIGYLLGIAFFAFVPSFLIGWVIMPFGVLITLWVLLRKVKRNTWREYVWLAVIWTALAILCDYFLLVKVFKPADGYYKLDVYLYYLLVLSLPLLVGWKKKNPSSVQHL